MSVFFLIVFLVMIGLFFHYLPKVTGVLLIALGLRSMYLYFYGFPEEMATIMAPYTLGIFQSMMGMGWLIMIAGFFMLAYHLNLFKWKTGEQKATL